MKKLLFFALCMAPITAICQTSVPLEEAGGVYIASCKINDSDARFIFDTGAAAVTLSLEYYNKAVANGSLLKIDVLPEVVNFQIANGDIIEGRMINLRSFKIGDLEIRNVLATIISSQDSDMLLGQTLLKRFGSYTIDNNNNKLIIQHDGVDVTSDVEKDYFDKGKQSGFTKEQTEMVYRPLITAVANSLEFARSVEFEVYKMTLKNREDGEYEFEFDITNSSPIGFSSGSYGRVEVVFNVITTDGKHYTDTRPLTESIQPGNTVEGPKVRLKVRNRTIKYVFVHCQVYANTVDKTYL